MNSLRATSLGALLLACVPSTQRTPKPLVGPPPSLVVVLTVDQLKAEYLELFADQLSGGLSRLRDGGAYFTRAYQDHAITETAPGHASMLSGRFPRSTGITANDDGVLDPTSPLLLSSGEGASPFRFRGTTLADWLRARNPDTRIVSVSRKDRAAILPVGRAKADVFWYVPAGLFTTSRYYSDSLPTWVRQFNALKLPGRYAGQSWELLRSASQYPERDDVPEEGGGVDFVFPHRLPADSAEVARVLPEYPMMDEVTLRFALAGLSANHLGESPNRTDLLAVSLSSTDAVGHRYGPDSRELRDQVLRLDRYLGAFLDSLYRLRDSTRVVLVLTADHGVAPSPNPNVVSRYRKFPGGYANVRGAATAVYRAVVKAGVDSTAFRYRGNVLFLEPGAFTRAGVSRDSVARVYAASMRREPGVMRADVYSDLAREAPSSDPITRRWQHMFSPDKNAAVVVTLAPYWYWGKSESMATHGSPHDYDAQVPIIFAGAGVRRGRVGEFTRVTDIAPTLAALVGVQPSEPLDGVILRRAIR